MRIIGIDLGVTAKHRAIIVDERSQFISPVIQFETQLAELERLRARALEGADPDCSLVVVMEATNIVWYPISVYFTRHGDTVHVVNPRMSADLARFYKRHAKSDRLSTKVLARLPLVSPESLYPLVLSGADYLAMQRGCRELDRLTVQSSAIKNRLQAIDLLGWPGLKQRVFSDPSGTAARWFRNHFYDPQRVVEAGEAGLRQTWRVAGGAQDDEDWIEPLVALAKELRRLYGDLSTYLDYNALAAEVAREQRRLADLEADANSIPAATWRPSRAWGRMAQQSSSASLAIPADSLPTAASVAGVAWCRVVTRVARGRARACASPRPVPTWSRSTPISTPMPRARETPR